MREVTPSSESIRNRSRFIYAAIGLAVLVVVGIFAYDAFSSGDASSRSVKDFKGYSMAALLAEAESGDVLAQLRVSEHYRDGTGGFAKSDASHFEWALRAAKAGNVRAKVYAGECYFHGAGTAKDYQRAHDMFIGPAAESNDPIAQSYMGRLNSGYHVFPRRDDLAVEWYRKSAAQGHPYGQANLGRALLLGIGVAKDPKEGVRLVRLGVENGVDGADSVLAWAYANGEGVEKDSKEAARLYLQSANKGNSVSAHNLAFLYLNGDGVIKDTEEALKWFRRASEGGYVESKRILGNLYHSGQNVAADPVMASKLYLEVAMAGDVECQRVMGVRYQHGFGVSADLEEAYAWFNIAASNGDSQAAGLREDVAKSLESEPILAAQKRSRELLKEMEAKKAKK
jgi:TPR repeat protein